MMAFPAGCVVEHNLLHLEADDPGYRKAIEYGRKSVPTVVVDGRIANCCVLGPVTEGALRRLQIDRPD